MENNQSETENKVQINVDEINQTEEIKIDNLINSVFKDKKKKEEIIRKLRPFFSLKVIPQKEIDRVYAAMESIEPEKVTLIAINNFEENKFGEKNIFRAKSKSLGLSDNDLDLSINILGHKQSFNYDSKEENSSINYQNSSKIHCIHSIVVKLFRIVIDFKDVKLSRQVTEELEEIKDSNATEKKILLQKLVDKFGLYVPLELLVGGRINYSFDANSEEEFRKINSLLQREINIKLGGKLGFVSGGLEGKFKTKNLSESSDYSLDKVENLYIKIEGGDYTYKEDFEKWIQSFNMDNLQIIEYKTLTPIYSFIPGLESKLSICLEKYEDIVLKEIYSLFEKEFIPKEKELYQGSSKNENKWEVGITQDNYKSFKILKKKIVNNLKICDKKIKIGRKPIKKSAKENEGYYADNLNYINNIVDSYLETETETETKGEKENNRVTSVICGEIPEGFIICGWILKTNANSKYYDVVGNWERQKQIQIIGNEYYKFKVDLNIENEISEDVNTDWILELYCIHKNYLISDEKGFNKKNLKNHFFINCDCGGENNVCYYKTGYEYATAQPVKTFPTSNNQKIKKNFGNLFS